MLIEEALTESWEELVGPLEVLLTGRMREDEALDALKGRANEIIDAHTLKCLEARHEL